MTRRVFHAPPVRHVGGRREALIDQDAPWLYRLTSLELSREQKLDNTKALTMTRYLYVDVRVDDVGGSGDQYCAIRVTGGFTLRAVTTNGTVIDGPQITGDYTSGHNWKRVAIPLPAGIHASEIASFVFDAYDDDGIYLTAIGDAFVPTVQGTNGAVIDYVRHGTKALALYVDDNNDGCTNSVNNQGPGGTAYQCVGGQVAIAN